MKSVRWALYTWSKPLVCFNILGSPNIFPSDDDYLLIFVPMINDKERSNRLNEMESEEEEEQEEDEDS